MRTGICNLPLHYGKTPPWLFDKMRRLARAITIIIVEESGAQEFLNKISSPFWFQSLGCILGFDWHSSGLTTTVCGALKDGMKDIDRELGLFICGGKGKTSRKTPEEIREKSKYIKISPTNLIYASRMAAKVDSACVQDGYQLYHHTFFFTKEGNWAVVQQGMNERERYARRYHWLSRDIDFVSEPHKGISAEKIHQVVLNMVAKESKETRECSAFISREKPDKVVRELKKIVELSLPERHYILREDIHPDRLYKIFASTYERHPGNFETLLSMKGVGGKTIRALSLISEVVYGKSPSFRDPARFSFAHGGKDGYPYPVDRENYERTINILENGIKSAKLGERDKLEALRRLSCSLPKS